MNKEKYIFLIPAYKPCKLLIELLDELSERSLETIVVNDGSGKEYNVIFEQVEKYAKVLTHKQNLGKGEALKTGFKYIKDNYSIDSVIVTVDADGQHKVADALKICKVAAKNNNNLILGSRKLDGKVPLRSKVGNAITRFVYKLVTKESIYDTQTGLRAFNINLIDELLNIKGSRYEYEMNVILELPKRNIRIKEVDIQTIYINDNRESHFDSVRDSYKIYKEIFNFSSVPIVCFIASYLIYIILLMLFALKFPINVLVANSVAIISNYILKELFNKYKNSNSKNILNIFIDIICNSLILYLLVILNTNIYFAKLYTEIILLFSNTIIKKNHNLQ